jgi:hypothetical protein
VSKFVIAVALAIGVAATAGSAGPASPGQGLGALITGVAVLCLAAFAPFVVLRLMPAAEAAVIAQGLSRAPMRVVQTAAYTTATVSSVGRLAGAAAPPTRERAPEVGHG